MGALRVCMRAHVCVHMCASMRARTVLPFSTAFYQVPC